MACPHPREERQLVFEGSATPRVDRLWCGLCGEIIYLALGSAGDPVHRAGAGRPEFGVLPLLPAPGYGRQ
jgi:hypothetical protein